MRRDVRALIEDIQRCISEIEEFTQGIQFETYDEVVIIQKATEREFITIGEAIRRMHQVSGEVSARIENAIAVSGFRNFLVHEYEHVDNKEVWRIVKGPLPKLKEQINRWAAELGMPEFR